MAKNNTPQNPDITIKLPKKLWGKHAITFIIDFRKKVDSSISKVILRAEKLELIDSGSIGFLIVEAMRLKRMGGYLAIKDISEEIFENFEIANVDQIIDFY